MRHLHRRGLATSMLLAVGGCGFHPLLSRGGAGSASTSAQLRAVFVPVQPERSGQLFREALQAQLYGANASVGKRFELSAPLSLNIEGLGIQRDTSTTRFRITGSTSWTLFDLTPQHNAVTSGYARLLDGYDNINQQYVSTAFESEAATRRLAENLASRVVQQLAAYFDRA